MAPHFAAHLAAHGTQVLADLFPPTKVVRDLTTGTRQADGEPDFSEGLAGVEQPLNYFLVYILLSCFCGLLAITFFYRWMQITKAHMRLLLTMRSGKDQQYWMHNQNSIWPSVKKSLIYAPLGKVRHNRELMLIRRWHVDMGTIPGRYQTILLLLYVASNVAYCLVLPFGKEITEEILADLRGRSGVLAVFNLIPTFLFAIRNNPLIPILSISYEAFNLLHRWTARVAVIEAVVHTVAWAAVCYLEGGPKQSLSELHTVQSYAGGLVSTCAFSLVILAAWSPIRHAFYETFLVGHRIFISLGIAGLWVHLAYADLPQMPWLELCVAIYGFELGWRFLRICYYNISREKGISKVTIEALPSEACRVTFDLSRPWKWQPGCHVHAYLPRYALWSSHPFSIAWAENKSRSAITDAEAERMNAMTYPRKSAFGTPSIAMVSEKSKNLEGGSVNLPRDNTVTSISLIMRARTGLTRKLYNKASASPTGTIQTWGAIEGPYGGHDDMASYGTVVLFAGGVGITHCVGYLHHLILRYQAGTSATQKILLVWSVPNTEALEWVRVWMDKVLRMEGRRDILRIQLFVTKPRHRGEVISNTGSVQMFPGRCNPTTVLRKEMKERIGAVGVTVCGPGAFSDGVRAAVRDVVEEGAVEFIEEAFTF